MSTVEIIATFDVSEQVDYEVTNLVEVLADVAGDETMPAGWLAENDSDWVDAIDLNHGQVQRASTVRCAGDRSHPASMTASASPLGLGRPTLISHASRMGFSPSESASARRW